MTAEDPANAKSSLPQLHRFEVTRQLGAGGMGVVCEAFDRERKIWVAIKMMRTMRSDLRLRFKNEFRAIQDIHHPNLVRLEELFEEDGQLYFTMELVQGTHFLDYVRPNSKKKAVQVDASGEAGSMTMGVPGGVNQATAGDGSMASMTMNLGPRGDPQPSGEDRSMAGDVAMESMTLNLGHRGDPVPLPPTGEDRSTTSDSTLRNPSLKVTVAPLRKGPAINIQAPVDHSAPPRRVSPQTTHAFDEPRLRSCLVQLANGLDAIHSAGCIHRDIKSSNVLVTPDGRVVILDFGLITDGDRAEHGIVGTAHFMAPEQAAGQTVSPAADWYSVGVMLYAALTGALPFRVSRDAVLFVKQFSEPEPPSALVPGLPGDLEELCVGLLRQKPEERISSLSALQNKLAGNVDTADVHLLLSTRRNFVGRTRELEELAGTLSVVRGRKLAAVFVEGESGMGKSALVAHYLDSLGNDALIFRGRCYERDSVPYKAVDEIISGLAYYLESLTEEEAGRLLPPDAGLLALIFPELDIATSVASMPRPARDAMDPVALRNAAFAALRELFRRIASTKLVILAVDDLQWTDADSVALLEEILGPPEPPPLLFLCTMRPAPEGSPPRLSDKLRNSMESVTTLRIGGLSNDDAEQLVSTLLQGAELPDGIDVSSLIGEAGGHPFFIDALVRHRVEQGDEDQPLRLDDALWSRVQRLDSTTRQLIEIIAVAGAPISLNDVATALEMAPDRIARSVVPLQAAKLVHLSNAGAEQRIESYHDRVRETVVSRIAEESRRSWHRALATALETSGRAEAETMAIHWRGAGELRKAAEYALRGGDQATNALAFDLAARLYRMALELRAAQPHAAQPDDASTRALMIKLGGALYNAGRGAEAARVFVKAYERAPAAQRLELTRRAAECFLHAGYAKEGIEHFKPVLAAARLEPFRSLPVTIAAFLFLRLRLRLRGLAFVHRREHEIDPEILRRIDICWGLSLSMSFIDALRGAYYQLHSLLLALDAGEPLRISRALAVVATFNSLDGVSTRGRIEPLIAEVFRTAELCGHPYALAFAHGSRGFIRFNQGQFQQGLSDLDRGVTLFQDKCVGAWTEHGQTLLVSLLTRWFLGDLREFSRRAAEALRHAEDSGNILLSTNLSSGPVNGRWLIEDKPAEASAELQRAKQTWSTIKLEGGLLLQDFLDLVGTVQRALYEGENMLAYQYIRERRVAIKLSPVLQNHQLFRVILLHCRTRTIVAVAAEHAGRKRDKLLSEALSAARDMADEKMEWGQAQATVVRATVAFLKEDVEGARALLAKATHEFDSLGMQLYSAATRRRSGELAGGEKGRMLVSQADAWMGEQGVASPARMTAMLLPGFPVQT